MGDRKNPFLEFASLAAVVTGAGYLGAFLFQAMQAGYYGFPVTLVSVSPSSALLTISVLALLTLGIVPTVAVDSVRFRYKRLLNRFVMTWLIIVVVVFSIGEFEGVRNDGEARFYGISTTALLLLIFALSSRRFEIWSVQHQRKHWRSLRSSRQLLPADSRKFKAISSRLSQRRYRRRAGTYLRLARLTFGIAPFLYALVLASAALGGLILGGIAPNIERVYALTPDNSEAVIYVGPALSVLSCYDSNRRALTYSYRLAKTEGLRFHYVFVGRLHPDGRASCIKNSALVKRTFHRKRSAAKQTPGPPHYPKH